MRQAHAEFEQAVIRLVVGTIVLAYVLFFDQQSDDATLRNALACVFLLAGTLLLAHVIFDPRDLRLRKYLGILNDTFFISASMAITEQNGQPIYLVYLWVIFGNGFRFGKRYLQFALALSIAGLSGVIVVVDYWHDHIYQATALLAGLALLSAYFGMLLNRLTDALKAQEAANAAKRHFISSVSHELRTPLNAIIGITDLLQSTHATASQKEMLNTLKSSSRLMHTLIDDVLDFSKIEAGKIIIERVPFDLHDLVEKSVAMFRPQASRKSLALSIRIAAAVPHQLIGDGPHLQQVLVNLLSNALKFTPAGKIEVRVDASPVPGGEIALLFEVEDTGIGIAPEDQEKIFESFTQASASTHRHYGGTGLGTTISRNLVQQMGGELALRSVPGVGSVFYFTLPFPVANQTEPLAEDKTASPPTGIKVLRLPRRSYCFLIADDNPTNRSIVQAILERAGHRCTLAANGDQALDCIDRQDFDAIVLDLHMPVLNGLDTLKAYRVLTREEHRRPVILFSADASVETEQECLAAGADAFLTKPIHTDRFLQTVEALAESSYDRDRPPRPQSPPVLSRLRAQPASRQTLDYSTLATLESISPGDGFMSGLIDSFIADGMANIGKLDFFLQRGDVGECHHVLHAMRGSAIGIGAVLLAQQCAAQQSADLAAMAVVVEAVREEMALAVTALDEYRQNRLQRFTR